MAYQFADLFEHIVDAVPTNIALIDRDTRLTFAELDERSNRVAHLFAAHGIGAGDHVGIYAQNSHEWFEAMMGAFKIRAIPININYRYVADELNYLFDNADLKAVVFDAQYAPLVAEVQPNIAGLDTFFHYEVHPGDGSVEAQADVLAGLGSVHLTDGAAAYPGTRDGLPERSNDDVFMIYTGGTTGMPKGVCWRHEDVYFALGQGINSVTGERVQSEFDMANKAKENGFFMAVFFIAPFMHGATQLGSLGQMLQGNTIVITPKFDEAEVWSVVDRNKVNTVMITGDAMGRPLIEHLEANRDRYDVSSIIALSSSAAIFSPTIKDRFLEVFPDLVLTDAIGSTESGSTGIRMVGKGQAQNPNGGPTVTPREDTVIFDEDWNILPPESLATGILGRGGNIPLGYYKDERKTAETFITAANGKRYVVSGDFARWEPTGEMTLLGRGSSVINSGGEKVHPEEVEQALKDHPAVYDCIVVGAPDERFGQKVAAIVQFRDGQSAELSELADHCRKSVAGYKVPRALTVVDEVLRSPSGKPDYPWAIKVAKGEA